MIIEFPTGLYGDKIPTKRSDSGSITWTVSTEEPTRPTTVLQQYPIARQLSELPESELTDSEVRSLYGDLIVTSVNTKTSQSLSNSYLFEIGSTIDAAALEAIAVQNSIAPSNVEIQHDNNIYDLKTLGLTDEEIATLNDETAKRAKELRATLASTAINLDITKNRIAEITKQISETENSINAISLTSLSDIKIKLENKLVELKEEKSNLEVQKDALEASSVATYNELLQISVLVR